MKGVEEKLASELQMNLLWFSLSESYQVIDNMGF